MSYELSYWETQAEIQLRRPVLPFFPMRNKGQVKNNRKNTRGRHVQTVVMKNGTTKQIRHLQ